MELLKPKVYLAGGFRTNWQETLITKGSNYFTFFNPREHGLEVDSKQYTTWDLFHVRNCDILFAYMEASNPSGYGLSLEIGFAKALGKTVILVDEKTSKDEIFCRYFKLVRDCSDIVFEDLENGIKYLMSFSNKSF